MTEAPRAIPTRVPFATPYLEVEAQSTSQLERTFRRELAQAAHAANRNRRKRRDERSSVQTRLACRP
jgi:hypothetical protein